MQLGWHNVLVHRCLSLEVVVSKLLFLFVPVFILVEGVVLQIVTIVVLTRARMRLHVEAIFVVLTTHSVESILVKVVAEWIVETFIGGEDVEAIFIVGAALLRLNLCLLKLDAKDTSPIIVQLKGASLFLGGDVDASTIVETTNSVDPVLIVMETMWVIESIACFLKQIKSIFVVEPSQLFNLFL